MKTKIILSTALLLMLAACSSNDNVKPDDDNKGKVDIAQGIEFKVNFKDFNADKEVAGSRASQKPDIISRKTVDLGNRLLAEVTVQRDTAKSQRPAVSTRALDNDTYTMLVFKGSFPSYTLEAQCTGTLKDGKFTPVGGVRLDPGKYVFVLHNSRLTKVTTPMGTPGLKLTRENADKALIGQTEYTVTATPDPQYVDFEMSHVGCRMRIKLTGWMPILASTTASLQDFNSATLPKDCIFEMPYDGSVTEVGDLSGLNEPLTFPASATTPAADGTFTTTSNEYLYFVPGINMEGFRLKFTGGQIYKHNMAGANIQLISLADPSPSTAHVTAINESYLVNINLKYNFLYLMSDGTTDFLNSTQYTALRQDDGKTKRYVDKQGNPLATPKVPIAIVLSQSRRMAIALRDADGGAPFSWTSNPTYQNQQVNKNMFELPDGPTAMFALENGYDETWDASASMDNTTVKGNSSDFPAFKAAGDYNPGSVSGTMIGKKWYLPAYGEWKYAFTVLGFGDITQVNRFDIYPWYGDLARIAFTQVGGTALNPDNTTAYWSSTECKLYSWQSARNAGVVYPRPGNFFWSTIEKHWATAFHVRPFVHY